jgi:hypothetical protein
MSYNIDTWEQIECSLTFPANALDAESNAIEDVIYGKPGLRTDVTIELSCEDGEITGVLENDVFTVEKVHCRSSGSGRMLDDLETFLELSHGTYQALLVWEGGDSITLFTVKDGAVENESLDIPALLKENAELKRRLVALGGAV